MIILQRRGQNMIEYTILIMIVASALIAMTVYMTRSMNARIRQTQDELNYNSQEQ